MTLVSIDGPTASGKTTLAQELSRRLDAPFLDTGLTYRGLAYAVTHAGVDPDKEPLETFLMHRVSRDGTQQILFLGEDISERLFDSYLDDALRTVAADQRWRTQVVEMHRRLVSDQDNFVAVGRDVAETLMPSADLSIYLYAAEHVRRERRRAQYRDMAHRSIRVGPSTERDRSARDFVGSRPHGLVIDSTYLPPKAVAAMVWSALESRHGNSHDNL
jgi:cytidylate kinase